MEKESNLAFIDGQNLHLGTTQNGWKVDHAKFRTYLKDKYHVDEAYYFLGYVSEEQQSLYSNLQKAGFIVLFKEHISTLKGTKKGNVDTDIVFEIMKTIIERKDFSKILLVSGDGDYKKVVDFLIQKGMFKKLLFPHRKFASSLYSKLGSELFDYLENPGIQAKIAFTLKKRAP
ncbi:MAG: NYN domain-containing protein [Candidatus Peribacter sp.]|nr:NYN domain-containing protein [Candidatus Peribacter sp.]